jgi:hypothetical protein
LQELVQGFDQETAAVVMARFTSLKMESEVLIVFFLKKILLKYLYLSFAACVVLVKTSLFLKNKYLIGNCNVVGHLFCQFVTVSCLTEIITCCLNKEETYFVFKFFSKYCHCYKIYVLLFQLMFILECHLFYDLSFTVSLVIIVSPFIEVTFICSFH